MPIIFINHFTWRHRHSLTQVYLYGYIFYSFKEFSIIFYSDFSAFKLVFHLNHISHTHTHTRKEQLIDQLINCVYDLTHYQSDHVSFTGLCHFNTNYASTDSMNSEWSKTLCTKYTCTPLNKQTLSRLGWHRRNRRVCTLYTDLVSINGITITHVSRMIDACKYMYVCSQTMLQPKMGI